MLSSAEGIIDVLDILSNLGNIFAVSRSGGGMRKALRDPVIVQKIRESSDEIAKKWLKKGDEPRAELITFMLNLPDEDARINLLDKHLARVELRHKTYPRTNYAENERYRIGDEDKFIDLLAKQYVSLNGAGKEGLEADQEQDMRENIFCYLGKLDDQAFDGVLEMLEHKPALHNLIKRAASHWPKIKGVLKRFDGSSARKVDELRLYLEKEGFLSTDAAKRKKGRMERFLYWLGR